MPSEIFHENEQREKSLILKPSKVWKIYGEWIMKEVIGSELCVILLGRRFNAVRSSVGPKMIAQSRARTKHNRNIIQVYGANKTFLEAAKQSQKRSEILIKVLSVWCGFWFMCSDLSSAVKSLRNDEHSQLGLWKFLRQLFSLRKFRDFTKTISEEFRILIEREFSN